jgi:hypothetical protein
MELFRYEDGTDSPHIHVYPVLRETRKCYVIDGPGNERGERFIIKDPGGRRFAYADREHAMWSYRRRKTRQIEHCQKTIDKARKMLVTIDVAVNDTLLFLEDVDAGY